MPELSQIHRRYMGLSNVFKSGWTFHQFLLGMQKAFSEDLLGDTPTDFQSLYGRLKDVSEQLTEATASEVSGELDEIDEELQRLTATLLAVDDTISPARLRQFFQRVKSYDDQILSQLVRFYLFTQRGDQWKEDRIDKVDYLTTKLCGDYDEERDRHLLREHSHIRDMAQGFWSALASEAPSEGGTDPAVERVRATREGIASVTSFEEVNDSQIVQRYRDLKHSLGSFYFHPKVLVEIVETNLALKNRVQELYRSEEQGIIAEYQEVFELESGAPVELGEELAEFRVAVERFESQLEAANVRIEELSRLRQRVRSLLGKLRPENGENAEPLEAPQLDREIPEGFVVSGSGAEQQLLAEQYELLMVAIEDADTGAEPKAVSLQPAVFALGVEPREVVAYRRLRASDGCDQELENFLLRAAAIRVRIEQEVEEIKSILDDSAVTGDSPVYAKARVTSRLGDLYVKRFEHLLERAVLEGDLAEARALQHLRMRLMRSYSGLWLMANKPVA